MARPSKPWFWKAKGIWVCTINGRRVRLGVQGEDNKKQAYEAWHRKMAGADVTNVESKAEPTVKEIVAQYLEDCRDRVKPKTLANYSDFLNPFVRKHGRLSHSSLTPLLAEAYSRKPQWSSTTRHDFLVVLVGVFKWADEKARIIDQNPLRGIRRPPKTSRGLETLITPDEHTRLVESATPWFRLFLHVLYATGARPGEVAKIDSNNFDPENGLVRLKDHKTAHKGKTRTIYLPSDAVELLKGQKEKYPTGPLLRNRFRKPWRDSTIVKAMQATREKAGLEGKICYGYRHTFATDALANGVPDAQVAELLGHSGTQTLHRHYSHLGGRSNVLRSALGKIRQDGHEADSEGSGETDKTGRD